MKRYPATFFCVIVSLGIQIYLTLFPDNVDHFCFDPCTLTGWIALLPHMLSHANWPHLIGNYTIGLPFMLYLEGKLGRLRFLEFYVICGLASAALHVAVMGSTGMIGSSGAIFGIIAGACMAFGTTELEHCLGIGFFCVLLTSQLQIAPMAAFTQVAIFVHIGGAIMGLILSTRVRYFSQGASQCTSTPSPASAAKPSL